MAALESLSDLVTIVKAGGGGGGGSDVICILLPYITEALYSIVQLNLG